MDDLTVELLDLLVCQVCWETLKRPIYRCKNEHLLCEGCSKQVTRCPSCREPFGQNLRCHSLEKLAEVVRSPCAFRTAGCPELVRLAEKASHEHACGFAPSATEAECPLIDLCSWLGSLADVEEHVREEHADELTISLDGTFSASSPSRAVLEFDSELFVVRAECVAEEDFCSHYVHVGHLAQGLHTPEARYRFKVWVEPDGELYKGLVTNYGQPLQDLASAGGCLFFASQFDYDDVFYSGSIKKLLA